MYNWPAHWVAFTDASILEFLVCLLILLIFSTEISTHWLKISQPWISIEKSISFQNAINISQSLGLYSIYSNDIHSFLYILFWMLKKWVHSYVLMKITFVLKFPHFKFVKYIRNQEAYGPHCSTRQQFLLK